MNNPLMALENFDRASRSEPQNAMAFFHKACVLMSLERFEEALEDLKRVRCLSPKEACVHFQLGKVYTKLRRDRKALLHFNMAMDLNRDSKDYHTVRTHIERLHIKDAGDREEPETRRCSQGRQQRLPSSGRSNGSAGDGRDPERSADGRGEAAQAGVERADHAASLGGGGAVPQQATPLRPGPGPWAPP